MQTGIDCFEPKCCSRQTSGTGGKGDAHVQIAADFARAVVEDCPNAAHPGIHHIAACGANGKFDGNTERDFQRLVRGFNGLSLEPYTIKLRLQVLSCYFGKFWFHGGLNFDPKSDKFLA